MGEVVNVKIPFEEFEKARKLLEEIDSRPPSEPVILASATFFPDEEVVKAFAHTSHLIITRDGSKWRHGVLVEE